MSTCGTQKFSAQGPWNKILVLGKKLKRRRKEY
jgi:hypothetical protein